MPRPKSPWAQTGAIFGSRSSFAPDLSDRAAARRPYRIESWSESAGGYVLLAGYFDPQAAVIGAEQRRGLVRVVHNGRVIASWKNGRRT